MKKNIKKATLKDRLPKNQGEWLKIVIKLTEKAMSEPSYRKTLQNQLDRLNNRLKAWETEK